MLAVALYLATFRADDAAVVSWLRTSAVRLKTTEAEKGLADMEPIGKGLSGVRFVAMGECTHGSREVFQMKHRMLEYLVRRQGYRVFAIEASMPDCVAMDEYVLTGKGDPAKALAAQGFWTWNTQEVLALLQWMRTYNADTANAEKLRVVGFDMQNRTGAVSYLKTRLGKLGQKDDKLFRALDAADLTPELMGQLTQMIDKVRDKVSPEESRFLDRVALVVKQAEGADTAGLVAMTAQSVMPFFWETLKGAGQLLKDFPDLSGDAKRALEMIDRGSREVASAPPGGAKEMRAYADALRAFAATHKDKATQFENSARLMDYFALAEEHKDVVTVNFRDKCMAENAQWISDTYLPGTKVMLWAHNLHIANFPRAGQLSSMGSYLTASLKEAYYPVGFAFQAGSFQARGTAGEPLKEWNVSAPKGDTVENAFAKSLLPLFFIDFATATEGVRSWLDSPQKSRNIGAGYAPDREEAFYVSEAPGKLYRAMIFIKDTTRARPVR